MRISRVQIDNYRNLRHVIVELDNIVALIGVNNSGKSNFLRALSIPLSSDDNGVSKRLSWFDINKEVKKQYYEFLKANRASIIDSSLTVEAFLPQIPTVTIRLDIIPEATEHYDVKDIFVDEDTWTGGILYQYFIKKPEELLNRVRNILINEAEDDNIQMSLLPMELYDYSITVPRKGNKIPYEVLARFRTVELPAERDNFASNADRLGSKALSDLLQKGLTSDSQVKIEKAYREFFDTVRTEGKLDTVLNWQQYSDIQNVSSQG